MFSEMMRMRPACARSPDAAMAIDFRKSTAVLLACCCALALANRRLDEAEAAGVERGRLLVIHLVAGDLDHLVLEIDGVAGRPNVEGGAGARLKLRSAACGSADVGAVGAR